jgi:peptidoglycan-associated lipoprotein
MKIKFLGALAALSLLAACNSPPPPATTGAGMGAGTMTPAPGGPAPGSQEDLVAQAGDRVFFAFNSSKLTPDAQGTIDKQAGFLQQYPQDNVQVAGNCDERGTEEYNLALGQRRANSDRDYLVAKGVASSRISTISYGKDRPTALGSNEEAWAQNRNAITTVQ